MVQVAALARHLREHPDVLSSVIEQLVADEDAKWSWAVRPKTNEAGQEEEEDGEPFLLEKLPNEVGKAALVSTLVIKAKRDPDAFLTLIQLALVSRDLRAEVQAKIVFLETRLDVVKLYARAMFDYFARDDETCNLFLARLRIYAPATYRAWLFLSRHPGVRDKVRQLVVRVRRYHGKTSVFNDFATWTCDGDDPIATIVAFHYVAESSSPFSQEDIQELLPLVCNPELALVLQPLSPVEAITRCDVTNYYELVRLAAVRARREILVQRTNDAAANFRLLLAHLPKDARYVQSDFHNACSDERAKREVSSLVDTLWNTLGSEATLDFVCKVLFPTASETRRIALLARWIKLEFRTRVRGNAFASLNSGGNLDHTVFMQPVIDIAGAAAPLSGADTLFASLCCIVTHRRLQPQAAFDFLFRIFPQPPAISAGREQYFLQKAIYHGNNALVKLWITQRWQFIANLPATPGLDAWSLLQPLLEAHFIEKHDNSDTGARQAHMYTLLGPWFRRFRIVIGKGHHIIPSSIPYGRYLLGDALREELEELRESSPNDIRYPEDADLFATYFQALSIRRMNIICNISRSQTRNDVDPIFKFPPEGNERDWGHALRLALSSTLPPVVAHYMCSRLLVPALPLNVLADRLHERLSSWNQDLIWPCLRSPQGQAFVQECLTSSSPRRRTLDAVAQNMDNPLIFLGQLRRHVNSTHGGYVSVVTRAVCHLVVDVESNMNYRGVHTLTNVWFYLRNLVMPFIVDDELPPSTNMDDALRGLPMLRNDDPTIDRSAQNAVLVRTLKASGLMEGRQWLTFLAPLTRLYQNTLGLEFS